MNFDDKNIRRKIISNKYKSEIIKTPEEYENLKKNLDKEFYLHYFGDIANNKNIPIEKFYHFRSWKKRFSKDIPKSVTKGSLSLWKMNPDFIKQMKEYIHEDFYEEFKENVHFEKTRMFSSVYNRLLRVASPEIPKDALHLLRRRFKAFHSMVKRSKR